MRGNVIDLAIGIIIGSAFTAVVQSLVNDILTPPLGLVIGGVDFSNLTIKMKNYVHKDQPDVVIRYGRFIQTVIYFIIVALVLFGIIKGFTKLHRLAEKRKKDVEKEAANQVEMVPVNEQTQVLREIRDLLAGRAMAMTTSPGPTDNPFETIPNNNLLVE